MQRLLSAKQKIKLTENMMKNSLLLEFLLIFSSLVAQASETNNATANFRAIFQNAVNNDAEAADCLLLDFSALIFDAVISLEDVIENEKFMVISNTLSALNTMEFKRVEDKRFHPANALIWHPFANMNITQFKSVAFKNLKSKKLNVEQLKFDIEHTNKEEIPNYIFKYVTSLACQDILQAIIDLWHNSSIEPGMQEGANVNCGVQ